MKNVKTNLVMLSFLGFVSVIIILGLLFGKPENIDKLSSFMYATLLVSGFGIVAYFMRDKDKYFRNSFLASYFGVNIFLIVFNITSLIYGYSPNVMVSLLIIGVLFYQMVYPFLNRSSLSNIEVGS